MKINFRKSLALISAAAVTASVSSCGMDSSTAHGEEILIEELTDELLETDLIDMITEETTALSEETVLKTTEKEASETTAVTEENPERNSGKVLSITSYNDEFRDIFEFFYGTEKLPDGIWLEYKSLPSYADEYTEMLDKALPKNDEPIDIFIVEPDYIRKYINSEFALPMSDLGITSDDTADMFPYTVSLGTDDGGLLKALTWQAEPGVFVYRRDIAMEVFGNDDPQYIYQLISSDWEDTAAALAEKEYYILSTADEAYLMYSQSRTTPWTNGIDRIYLDTSIRKWAEDMCRDIQNGYNPNYTMWTDEWITEQSTEGKTFGFCLASWGSQYLIPINSDEGNSGKWGICQPPKPYYWGGSFICVSSRTDNLDLCADIIRKITCDSENMAEHSIATQNCCNSRSAMKALAENDLLYSDFYVQNPFDVYFSAADSISLSNITPYDFAIDEKYKAAMADYFKGYITYEEAESNFLSYD